MSNISKSKLSRIFPVLLVVLVVVFLIFVLVSIGRTIFSDTGKNNQPTGEVKVTPRDELLVTTQGRAIRMVVRGPIVADEDFRSYQIIITPTSRQLVIYKGYLGELIDKVELTNNEAAYAELVHALDKQRFGADEPFVAAKDDTRGVCASGTVSEFDIIKDDRSVYHVWTSTCSGSKGSLTANEANLRNLLLKQIPDNSKILAKFRS